ncbi:MAG: baseplate wedge protein 53 [Ignisphaera sp.]|jgi:hypothetical protein|nr:baseplate wedge protein 53 [Ignisphaera sp.]
MSLTTKWDGSIKTPSDPSNERTTKLGTFISINKTNTYYPLPAAYAKLLSVQSLYKVPAKFGGRPDLIALDVYQDAALWWVVLWANDIVDPFARPAAGEVINIINIAQMKKLLT